MEIEVKLLDIQPEEVRQRLKASGCTYLGREFQRNLMFDYPDRRLYETRDGSYIRIRQRSYLDSGDSNKRSQILLTYKEVVSREQYKIAEETELEVGDLKSMKLFLEKLGLVQVRLDEKIRESYAWQDIHFEIDEWAGLPPYLEVEAEGEERVKAGLEHLGYRLEDATSKNLREVLALYNIEDRSLCFADFGRQIELKP